MTISGGSALSKDDIERMVRDAEKYAEEDAARRESVETRNQADSLVYSTEKFLSENDDKLPEDVKTEVRTDVDELKKLLESDDTDKDALAAAIAKVGESSQKMGAAMYEAAAAEAPADGEQAETTESQDDDVVDAEIVDETDETGDDKKDESK